MLRKTGAQSEQGAVKDNASMRPQRNAAENVSPELLAAIAWVASMRPQRNAAENPRQFHRETGGAKRFNEAAA